MLIVGIILPLLLLWTSPSASAQNDEIGFGFYFGDSNHVSDSDIPSPQYEAVWATNDDGVQTYVGDHLANIESRGRTPVVHFYYWGDHISPNHVEYGYYDDAENLNYNREDWHDEADKLIDQIQTKMDGKETIVTIELEFHKNGIADPSYEDKFESYLVDMVEKFRAVDGVKTIVGFGEWGTSDWTKFEDAVNKSQILGTQLLWSTYRDQGYPITDAAERIDTILSELKTKFPDPVHPDQTFIYDFGVSSWGDDGSGGSNYTNEEEQAQEIAELRYQSDTFNEEYDLQGFIFRSLNDDGNENEWHGPAECCWGYASEYMDYKKDGFYEVQDWLRQEDTATADTLHSTIQAENFDTKHVGRLVDNTKYNGDQAWNIAANGSIETIETNQNPGDRNITIKAEGQQALDELPHMQLYANGELVDEWDVYDGKIESYNTQVDLPEGDITFEIRFTNNYYNDNTGENRDLFVDIVFIGDPDL
jgi:hypothetical protein